MAEITHKLAANNGRQFFFAIECSILGRKSSANLHFAASKRHVTIHRQCQLNFFKMDKGLGECSGKALLAPCPTKKRLRRK